MKKPLKGQGKWPGRPPRLPQIFQSFDNPLYYITAVTSDRRPLLANPTVHQSFIAYATPNLAAGRAIGRYVIMPEHVHFFARISTNDRLSDFVRLLKQSLTRALRRQGLVGVGETVWQPGFFDHLLRSDESYAEKWAYVRENPVRKQLVANADDWPFQGEITRIDRARRAPRSAGIPL